MLNSWVTPLALKTYKNLGTLQKVKRDLLVKGKGALWCVEKWAENEPTQPHRTPGTSKCLKITIMKDKRACVEAFHQELVSKHGGKYSRPLGRGHWHRDTCKWGGIKSWYLFPQCDEDYHQFSHKRVLSTYVAKTVTWALKGNKKPPKQVAPPILDTYIANKKYSTIH